MHVRLELEGDEYDMWIAREGDTVKIEVDGQTLETRLGQDGLVRLGDDTYTVRIAEDHVLIDDQRVDYRVLDYSPGGAPGDHKGGGARGGRVKPPMPGKIVSVAVNEGDEVAAGDVLVILEAMKMQNEITAPAAGVVKKVHVKVGQNVEGKDVLVELE